MKKLFFVLAVAALAACNSGSETKEEVKPVDTTAAPAPAPADTTAAPAPADTTAAAK